ncbi:hypothetical protein PHYBLDRAFT_166622 [Phycomyces blakesleeanus NRRL 1555(-)]|uniref:Uncharacterized protein n=1 Tax=Phycomyces blakesleeanus (strain ATCC 8743b / DSM 1359 / FGSC 10004 / NBRC 33097 / NRRL 1555) TaxID=763407 RepID=A0A162XJY9_PHYB8|nr:hypothetical protein PHYBLDRAFT_166622 [Phycomyces blakesleeanus NRRL 1555(-)]OAD75375.1 hypothetical protein PHYBLDRAFT_166622 [Phycomyces blakesleeanus NRRL 1555(-)]|eukprot:XP_018293415.1 hypothetical protein PHYBLDRAFT_166622 [Phycomyces blakesleeanus NRRL 1555(-)]
MDTELNDNASKIDKSASETDKPDNGSNINMEELQEKVITNRSPFKLSHLDALLNYQSRKKYKLPVLTSTSVTIDLPKNKSVLAYVNMPSDHLKLLATNPMKAKSIFAMPDHFWFRDVVEFAGGSANACFLVESFHTIGISVVYAQGYNVLLPENNYFVHIETKHTSMRVEKLLQIDASPINIDFCFSVLSEMIDPVLPVHWPLLLVPYFLKQCISQGSDSLNNKNCFYKVRIAPITPFTDDMSGSQLKQYDSYKSWSMKCVALSFEERSLMENIYFLLAIPKKDSASGMTLLSVFVKDLKMLENRLVMFSTEDNKYILVIAPLLWIEADTPCHFKLCDLCAPTCLTVEKLKDEIHCMGSHASRTKDNYQIAASTSDRSSTITYAPLTGKNFKASELSFRYRATDILLDLDSSDLLIDTPVEILYNILLSVAKYLVTDLVKVVLKRHSSLLNKLIDSLKEYRKSQDLLQNFTRLLRHCSSFLGREFKILIQILPIVLATKFVNNNELSLITSCFVHLGCLCSLVFVRAFKYNYNFYITKVKNTVASLIQKLYFYDKNCGIKSHKSYILKPKVSQREHYGDNTAAFFHKNIDNNFQNILFGRLRDFTDNNDIDNIADLSPCNNTFGVFALKKSRDQPVHYIIGKIFSLRVEHYRVESSVQSQENNFFLAQRFSNNLTTLLNQLTMICKLDMHIHYDNNLVINLNKLRSYWFFASQVYNRWY